MEPKYLEPTYFLDSDHPDIKQLADQLAKEAGDDLLARAIHIYYWVRDRIWYDPYRPFHLPEHYQASRILKAGRGFCITKASLLCALGRAAGIPARVGFAAVRNHMATKQLKERMGNDIFDWHGFVEFHPEDHWVKCTPAFNADLCVKFNVAPLEFNGRDDSIFHEYNTKHQQFMTYDKQYGTFSDIPYERIVAGWTATYGEDRVAKWIKEAEAAETPTRDFANEEIIRPE
jgi:transglutaminase-like putative cysteine protease